MSNECHSFEMKPEDTQLTRNSHSWFFLLTPPPPPPCRRDDFQKKLSKLITGSDHHHYHQQQQQKKRSLLPNYFRDISTLASQIHSNNTRNSNLFYIPYCRTNLRKFSIRFQGPTFFNSLSREIQNSESISLFGRRLKNSFFLSKLTLC